MGKTNATRNDVLRAIAAGRLRVDAETGTAEYRRIDARAVWRPCCLEPVKAPHQKLPYFRITFTVDGETFRALIHRVVWWVARGEVLQGVTVNHENGDKASNGIGNLTLMTYGENLRHGFAQGLIRKTFHTRSLSEAQVREVCARLGAGEPGSHVAIALGTTENVVSRIGRGQTYKLVE